MRRSFCLILAMLLTAGMMPVSVYAEFVNPLKNYNLYEDVHRNSDDERDNVMSEVFYSQNGLNNRGSNVNKSQDKKRKTPPSTNPSVGNIGNEIEIPQRRNDYLRESSKKIYAAAGTPRWSEDKAFYATPALESIMEKYRRGDYAGCMQECEAYVKASPNDTIAFYYLAMCYAKADDKDNAIRAYEKVISLHANPMIVKYATNGRNCIVKSMQTGEDGEEEIKCFENVNEPDYIYPYKDIAKSIEITPVDPQTLIDRNVKALQNKIVPPGANNNDSKIKLPFGSQDAALDEFINAPYGSGLSPELEKQYKQIQLRELQQNLNNGNDIENNPGKYFQNIRNIKEKIDKKSESETIKLAMAEDDDLKDFFNSPEYLQSKKELDQINMMFGDYKSENGKNDLMDIIPALSQGEEKLSPQAMQMIMMQSVMPDIINIDGKNSF